jgi:S1-C subfamily serine protease
MQRSHFSMAIVAMFLVGSPAFAQTAGARDGTRAEAEAVANEAANQAAQQTDEALDAAAATAEDAVPQGADASAAGTLQRDEGRGQTPLENQPLRRRDRPAAPAASQAARRPLTPQQLGAGLQFGQSTREGLPLTAVAPDSFLYDRGLRTGDVLVTYGGQPIRSQDDFSRLVRYQSGQRVPVVVVREGRPQTVYVVYDADGPLEWHAGTLESEAYLGITFEPNLNQPATVAEVAPISPGEQAGVRPGDIISEINGRAVANWQQVAEAVSAFQPGADLQISISRPIKVAARPNPTPTAIVTPRVGVVAPAPPAPIVVAP